MFSMPSIFGAILIVAIKFGGYMQASGSISRTWA